MQNRTTSQTVHKSFPDHKLFVLRRLIDRAVIQLHTALGHLANVHEVEARQDFIRVAGLMQRRDNRHGLVGMGGSLSQLK